MSQFPFIYSVLISFRRPLYPAVHLRRFGHLHLIRGASHFLLPPERPIPRRILLRRVRSAASRLSWDRGHRDQRLRLRDHGGAVAAGPVPAHGTRQPRPLAAGQRIQVRSVGQQRVASERRKQSVQERPLLPASARTASQVAGGKFSTVKTERKL